MCYIHSAALIGEYLKRKGLHTGGCNAFKPISPNLLPDECILTGDEDDHGEIRYTSVSTQIF